MSTAKMFLNICYLFYVPGNMQSCKTKNQNKATIRATIILLNIKPYNYGIRTNI